MRYLVFASFFLFQIAQTCAQGVLIGDTAQAPHPSARLEVRSNQGGFLPPRLTTNQRDAIVNPAMGLTIYNVSTECLQVHHGTGWKDISCKCNSIPTAAFTYSPGTVFLNSTVQFTASNGGQTYQWSFQSGTPASSNAANPSVSWSQAGTYQVILTETNSQGCSFSDTQQVVVQNCQYQAGNQTFSFTGAPQTFTVPQCVNQVTITCRGAAGAQGHTGSQPGGQGGVASGTLSVNPGQTLHVYVGGQGQRSNSSPMLGGWNGGGNGYNYGNTSWFCAGGGGASDVRVGGTALSDRVIVAGGGGGGGGSGSWGNGAGGNGGGLTGQAGYDSSSGGYSGQRHGLGGTQSSGGAGGANNNNEPAGQAGSLGQGGNASTGSNTLASGGGGGYYGGGGGSYHGGGGGGGSSYIGGVTNGSTQTGGQSGNGQVLISW